MKPSKRNVPSWFSDIRKEPQEDQIQVDFDLDVVHTDLDQVDKEKAWEAFQKCFETKNASPLEGLTREELFFLAPHISVRHGIAYLRKYQENRKASKSNRDWIPTPDWPYDLPILPSMFVDPLDLPSEKMMFEFMSPLPFEHEEPKSTSELRALFLWTNLAEN